MTSLATVSKRCAAINGLAPAAAAMFINGGDACDCGGEAAEAFNEEEEEDEDETRRGYDFRALMTVTGSVETVEVEVAVVNRLFELALRTSRRAIAVARG